MRRRISRAFSPPRRREATAPAAACSTGCVRGSRGRTACRSSAAARPARYSSRGQKRDESGVSTSSIRISRCVVARAGARVGRQQAELELRVGDDDAARLGVRRARVVEPQRHVARRAPARAGPTSAAASASRDVDVVAALRLGRRREDRRRQPVRLAQAGGQRDAADRRRWPGSPSTPTLTDSRAPRTRSAAARLWRTSIERPASQRRFGARLGGIVGRIESTPRDWATIDRSALEPERGDLRQDLALVGNARPEHVVEGGDPIGGDDDSSRSPKS